ncbi:hypothetical protein QWY85_20855 [Neolewinella lacunae]|uniref:Uncharacterized protein n=1 Tax=Neolewinella lacunae TaxID=1517758 RepID=A0A923PN29_9BACT|nr:hypothetical protein [Neolewinella lacunae]MBC6994248.1 hypothetical protein [Neolewinella lacunae]MDN3637134.1 hypothetical protein [Neolewinella lacunae]
MDKHVPEDQAKASAGKVSWAAISSGRTPFSHFFNTANFAHCQRASNEKPPLA